MLRLVNAAIRQGVRLGVLFTGDVLDAKLSKRPDAFFGYCIERLQRCMLDLIASLKLTHQKLRVGEYLNVRISQRLSSFQREEKSAVFRNVIRRLANPAVQPLRNVPVQPKDHNADAGRARVPSGSTIYEDANRATYLRRLAPGGRGRSQSPQCSPDSLDGFWCGDTRRQAQHPILWQGVTQISKTGDEICGVHAITQQNRGCGYTSCR